MKKLAFSLVTAFVVTAFSVQSFSAETTSELVLDETTTIIPDGTRSNPYRLGDTFSFKSYSYDGNYAEYSITFSDYWNEEKVKAEYSNYTFGGERVAARGNMSILSASIDDAVNINVDTYFISSDMNENYGFYESYSAENLNNQIYNVYSGGQYDFLLMSTDMPASQDISYIKIVYYPDDAFNSQTIWITTKDLAPATSEESEIEKLQQQIVDLKAEIERLKNLLDAAGISYDISQEFSSMPENIENQDGYTAIELNEVVSLDFTEFVICGYGQGEEIYPDNPGNVYRYMQDIANQSYFYVWGTLKNTSGNSFEFADSSLCNITFDNKYNYTANITADEGGNFSYIYAYLDPLVSEKFYIVVSIPDELASSFSTAEVKFSFMENFDRASFNVKEEDYDYRFKTTITK